jgi:hypothetical protein
MSPTVVGLLVFSCTLGGALVGNWSRRMLPTDHLSGESKDTVRLGIGLIATMTALVLGLVTASAKSSFDAVDTAVRRSAMDVLTLDRLLARYGPETREIRGALQKAVASRIDTLWPRDSAQSAPTLRSGARAGGEGLADAIRALTPRDDFQRSLRSRALDLSEEILEARWLVLAADGTSVPLPFLVILVFWLTITFASFGLFAPRNATVLVVLFVCALSVASSMFLILEMDGPFQGFLRVSADPFRHALANLNQ